ncbi:interferon alpha-H-like [Polypterus senegalus]|uniref:interferon alpha-H-like n=1 Tax=Polypterus senegalus TaxID=55291 RepID=UPI001963FA1E|nr:interferon alpha-H-like [Polypterus senegalus]
MPAKYLLRVAAWVLCVSQMVCSRCTWDVYRNKHARSLQALEAMGGHVPKECTGMKNMYVNFRMSRRIDGNHLREGNVLKTAMEIVHHTEKIFTKNYSLANWDEKNVELLRTFLHRLRCDLKDCVNIKGGNKTKGSNKRVKKYFKNLENYLKDKKYNRCAWEMVRKEIRTLLQRIGGLLVA